MQRKRVIVSLTSYPKRIHCVDKVIKTMLIQTMKPDRILLWLAENEFNNRIDDLPNELVELCDYGLEIRWCNDVKSHKKYLYAMREYPDCCIITIDDDTFYFPDTVEVLYKSFLRHPQAVSCLRANRITFDVRKRINPYSRWVLNEQEFVDIPLMDLMAVGVGGVLYPPGCIEKQFLDENKIIELCLCQDDIWLKFAQIHSGVKTVIAEQEYSVPKTIEGTERNSLSSSINVFGNDEALQKLGKYYDCRYGQDAYIDNILLSNKDTCAFIEKEREQKNKDILEKFRDNSIVIYGAGRDACAVYDTLCSIDERIGVRCFVVTNKKGNSKYLYGIPVIQVDEINIKENTIIIVAMDECWHEEIAKSLLGFSNCEIYYVSNVQMGLYFRGKLSSERCKKNFFVSLRR